MSLYSDIIPRLNNELRDAEAWPDDASKLDEQLNLLYNAALAIGKSVPLSRLTLSESGSLAGLLANGVKLKWYSLDQENIFSSRYAPGIGVLDYGIAAIIIDDIYYSPGMALNVDTILTISNYEFQNDRVLFALDYPNQRLYVMNADTDVKLYHAKGFTRPINGAVDWPLSNDNLTQRAIHIVGAHVSGVTIKDPAGSQFQALLEQTYAG